MEQKETISNQKTEAMEKPKRKVGRPRKNREVVEAVEVISPVEEVEILAVPKKRPGRPRKDRTGMESIDNGTMQPLGKLLRHARYQKHMKISSIAKKLCIKEVYLEALEQGHYYAFPALVYGAGFLRAYAKFLGLDADEMAKLFRQETTDIQSETLDMPRVSHPNIIPKPKVIIGSLLALLFLYLIWNVYKVMTNNPFPLPAMPVASQSIQVKEGAEFSAPTTADDLSATTSEAAQKAEAGKADKKELPPVPVSRRVGISYGLKTPARVSFLATDTVQIEIRDVEADSALFQKTLEAGDRYNPVDGVEGLILRTTNAGGLDVYVDGKKIRTLGKKGQIKAGIAMDAASLLKD